MSRARNLFLIIRGDKPIYHNAPYHPIIICTRKHTAQWESKGVENGATLLYNAEGNCESCNWFLGKYKGYTCENGCHFTLFDGVETKSFTREKVINEYVKKSVWWSNDKMPKWIEDLGVKIPSDDFSQKRIKEDVGICLLPFSKQIQKFDK